MYAETEIMSPYFHTNNFSQQDIFCHHSKPNSFPGLPSFQTLAVSDYGGGLWGDNDLFRAPEPFIEEPMIGLDPMAAAISMISSVEDLIVSPQSLTVSDVESSIEAGQLVSEVFYECRKDLLAKDGNETPLLDVLKIEIPTDGTLLGLLGKCVSSGSLRSMELGEDNEDRVVPPGFLDCPGVDFGAGMRRAFSEGDIKTLDDNNNNSTSQVQSLMGQPNKFTSQVQSLMGQPNKFTSACASEGRREKLSRYWSKKSKRNFDRKIKYACRKALADSQPRVRGRFAKTEASEGCKK